VDKELRSEERGGDSDRVSHLKKRAGRVSRLSSIVEDNNKEEEKKRYEEKCQEQKDLNRSKLDGYSKKLGKKLLLELEKLGRGEITFRDKEGYTCYARKEHVLSDGIVVGKVESPRPATGETKLKLIAYLLEEDVEICSRCYAIASISEHVDNCKFDQVQDQTLSSADAGLHAIQDMFRTLEE